jgi:hypothetical protein
MAAEAKTIGGPIAAPPLPGLDVYRAISDVTKVLSRDGIGKNRSNSQQGYSFRGIDDVYNALSGALAGADLCILPRMTERTVDERQTKTGGTLFYVTVCADFDFVSARDGSRHTVTMYGEAMDSGDKATNKAMSAAYKYCAMQVFCIPTEGMPDADATTHEPEPKSKPGPTAAPKPAAKPGPTAAPKPTDPAPTPPRPTAAHPKAVPLELTAIAARVEKDPRTFGTAVKLLEDALVDKAGTVEGLKVYDAICDEFYAQFPQGTTDVNEMKNVLRKLHEALAAVPAKSKV